MSGAQSGAVTGAASGAAAGGSVAGPYGAVIGGVIGGASGYLGGDANDKKAAASRRAAEAYARALQRNIAQNRQAAGEFGQQASQLGVQELGQQSQMADELGNMAGYQSSRDQGEARFQEAFAARPQNLGTDPSYLSAMRQNLDNTQPYDQAQDQLFQLQQGQAGMAANTSMVSNKYNRKASMSGAELARLQRLYALHTALNDQEFAQRGGQANVDFYQAGNAGAGEAVAGQLLQTGGQMAAGYYGSRGNANPYQSTSATSVPAPYQETVYSHPQYQTYPQGVDANGNRIT